jgi:prepilin-type N-terminal cleavage/methylation domain-containing protein
MHLRKKKGTKILTAGFTLMELLIVISMIAIISAIAMPQFNQWRQNLQYKETADGILAALRTAKSNAVSHNIQNRLECNPAGNRYRITAGNRAYNSTTWTTVKQDWTTVPQNVTIKTGNCDSSDDKDFLFNPNGTASAAGNKICVMVGSTKKYEVTVADSGRIRCAKP